MIWASRHFQKGNPQNLLRPSDLMRTLVPWRAFGDLEAARRLVPEHEAQLVHEEEQKRDARLADIEDAYGPVLEPLPRLEAELATLDALDLKVQAVKDAIAPEHPYFHPLTVLQAEVERIEDEIVVAGRRSRGQGRIEGGSRRPEGQIRRCAQEAHRRHQGAAQASGPRGQGPGQAQGRA